MSEQFAVDLFLPLLESRLNEVNDGIAKLSRCLKETPLGRLRIIKHVNVYQYYLIEKKGDLVGRYIPRDEDEVVRRIVQRDYDEKALKELKRQQKWISMFLEGYKRDCLDDVYDNLHAGRKIYATPFRMLDDAFVAKFLAEKYVGKPFPENMPVLLTSKGERVRSKSELLIADSLAKMNVPYCYEKPLRLKGMGRVYPDFRCLNVRTRKEFIWEHFGMMDNSEYATKAVKKEIVYEENGFCHDVNLIITKETRESPLDAKRVVEKIKRFLL